MTNTETITLSKAEYEALLQEKEDLEDLVAVMEADRSDELIPHDIAVAIARGGNPITVFRNYMGLSLRELARRAGISAGYLSEIEGGTKAGSAAVLARIAREVGTTIDALMVDDEDEQS